MICASKVIYVRQLERVQSEDCENMEIGPDN
jgi:hypothetical protein